MNGVLLAKKIILLLLTISLCLASFLFPVHAVSATREDELYIAMFFVPFPDGAKGISTMIVFDFNDTTGLPINMSSPAFENIQTAYFTAYVQGLVEWRSFFEASYASINQDLANQYSDEACAEFLQALGLNVSIIDRSYQINNQTSAVETTRTLAAAPYDMATTNLLLNYKPSAGLGNLMTQQFLAKYLLEGPEGSTGMQEVDWKLRKDGGTFYWELTFTASSITTWLSGNETNEEITFDLNEFLNYTGTVSLNQSKIVIETENASRLGSTIYTLDVTNMSPAGTISWDQARTGTVITFAPPIVNSVDNIILRMVLNHRAAGPDWTMIAVVIVVAILAANAVGIFLHRRLGKKSKKINGTSLGKT